MATEGKESRRSGSPLLGSNLQQQQHAQRQGHQPAAANTGSSAPGSAGKRTVCDLCRTRRIRCDGQFPCRQCVDAGLDCKRDHVPRKRGPKRGRGRVINVLRASQGQGQAQGQAQGNIEFPSSPGSNAGGAGGGPQWAAISTPATPPDISWSKVVSDPRNAAEPQGSFTTDQYRPTTRSYLHLMPLCVDLYYQHIYPIMPLLYMPTIRAMISRPMEPGEKNLIYALSGLTCFHMSGKSTQSAGGSNGPESWEVAGRFFLDECIATRQSYDFLEDMSPYAIISSFWLSTSFFEINQSRKSWVYLREALTLALEMGLDDEATYFHLDSNERLCRQRLFWQLFVTERSFAILRNKPITFRKTPSLPTTRHAYESPEIHSGFLQLISSYIPLDESFVTAWNDGSDPRVSAATYLSLQDLLAIPPAFLSAPHGTVAPPPPPPPPPPLSDHSSPAAIIPPLTSSSPGDSTGYNSINLASINTSINNLNPSPSPSTTTSTKATATATDDPTATTTTAPAAAPPGPTAIQKADLLITQQWLRLIVWQSSCRQNLVGHHMPGAMNSAFPVEIARRTAGVLAALPATAVEVHGMGIFEKIYEIAAWCVNVLGFCDTAAARNVHVNLNLNGVVDYLSSSGGCGPALELGLSGSGIASGSGSGRGGNGSGCSGGGLGLGVLGLGRKGVVVDPIEFFVRTLSASPNSRTQFADRLLRLAAEHPAAMKTALSPPLSPVFVAQVHHPHHSHPHPYPHSHTHSRSHAQGGGATTWGGARGGAGTGSVLGEVADKKTSESEFADTRHHHHHHNHQHHHQQQQGTSDIGVGIGLGVGIGIGADLCMRPLGSSGQEDVVDVDFSSVNAAAAVLGDPSSDTSGRLISYTTTSSPAEWWAFPGDPGSGSAADWSAAAHAHEAATMANSMGYFPPGS